jgi:hypothetical protein
MNTNCFGLTAIQCTGNIFIQTYSDGGDCLIETTESVMYELNSPLTVNPSVDTLIPGNWTSVFGDLSKIYLSLEGDYFVNRSQWDLSIRVTMQYGWLPTSIIGSSRYMYILRNNSKNDIVLANYASSTNTDVSQVNFNVFTLKPNEFFVPYAWQDSAEDALLGSDSLDPITGTQLPKTTITIERYYRILPTPT